MLSLLCILQRSITCQHHSIEPAFVWLTFSCFFSRCFRLRRQDNPEAGSVTHGGGVSVNVPQFFVPPVENMSKVTVGDPGSSGPEAPVSHPHEKQRSISLPDVCRESVQPLGSRLCFGSLVFFMRNCLHLVITRYNCVGYLESKCQPLLSCHNRSEGSSLLYVVFYEPAWPVGGVCRNKATV